MTLHADMNTDPTVAAQKFMRANNLDDKFLPTLIEVISDQQRQIREQQEWARTSQFWNKKMTNLILELNNSRWAFKIWKEIHFELKNGLRWNEYLE